MFVSYAESSQLPGIFSFYRELQPTISFPFRFSKQIQILHRGQGGYVLLLLQVISRQISLFSERIHLWRTTELQQQTHHHTGYKHFCHLGKGI